MFVRIVRQWMDSYRGPLSFGQILVLGGWLFALARSASSSSCCGCGWCSALVVNAEKLPGNNPSLGALASTSSMAQSVAMLTFAQGDCAGVPSMISFMTLPSCNQVACVDGMKIQCIDQATVMYTFANQVFGTTQFVLLERFTNNNDCKANASIGTAVIANGQCAKSATLQKSAMATLENHPTNSPIVASVQLFNDTTCQGPLQVTKGAIDQCLSGGQYRLLSNRNGSTTGAPEPTNTSLPTATNQLESDLAQTLTPRSVPKPMQFSPNSNATLLIQVSIGSIAGFLLAVVGLIIVLKKRHEAPQSECDTLSSVGESRYDHTGTSTTGHRLNNHHPTGRVARRPSRHGSTSIMSKHVLNGSIQEIAKDPAILVLRIPFKDLTQHEQIGHSSISLVYRGSVIGRGEVAIKRLGSESRKDSKSISLLFAEVFMLSKLQHPNVIQLIGVAWDLLTNLCVVYEFMARGDLRRLIECYHGWEYPKGFDETKLRIAFGTAKALSYLHSRTPKVIHGNLKSSNVLLTEAFEPKLTSLNVSPVPVDRSSVKSSPASVRTMIAGFDNSRWMAPEVLLGQKYDERADIFSFGVVLSELDTHELPYQSALMTMDSSTMTRNRASTSRSSEFIRSSTRHSKRFSECVILKQVARGQVHARFTCSHLESEVVALAMNCLRVNPNQRPSAAEVSYKLHLVLKKLEGGGS